MDEEQLIQWKTEAWKDPAMVALYSKSMEEQPISLLKNRVEIDLCTALVKGTHILDVGIGTGRASLPLAANGLNVTGIDCSQAMLDECQRLAENIPVKLMLADVVNLPFDDCSFDSVMALDVLTHFPHWQTVLTEWSRVVRPGGRILFDVHSNDHYVAAGALPLAEGDFLNFRLRITLAELATFATANGFAIAEIVPYGGLFGNDTNHWINASLEKKHWWNELLSWLPYDTDFFEFAVFLEQRLFGYLNTCATGRFMVALDRRVDPACNEAWVQRNESQLELIRQGVELSSLATYFPEDEADWRAALNSHLQPLRNQMLFSHLIFKSFDAGLRMDLSSFLDANLVIQFTKWREQILLDDQTLRLIREWHQQPELTETLSYRGISLGKGLEYQFMQEFLEKFYNAFNKG